MRLRGSLSSTDATIGSRDSVDQRLSDIETLLGPPADKIRVRRDGKRRQNKRQKRNEGWIEEIEESDEESVPRESPDLIEDEREVLESPVKVLKSIDEIETPVKATDRPVDYADMETQDDEAPVPSFPVELVHESPITAPHVSSTHQEEMLEDASTDDGYASPLPRSKQPKSVVPSSQPEEDLFEHYGSLDDPLYRMRHSSSYQHPLGAIVEPSSDQDEAVGSRERDDEVQRMEMQDAETEDEEEKQPFDIRGQLFHFQPTSQPGEEDHFQERSYQRYTPPSLSQSTIEDHIEDMLEDEPRLVEYYPHNMGWHDGVPPTPEAMDDLSLPSVLDFDGTLTPFQES